jgi:hypothetical protein
MTEISSVMSKMLLRSVRLRLRGCGMQTARYLVKALLAAQAGKPSGGGSAEYTRDAAAELRQRCPAASARDCLDPSIQSSALRCPGRFLAHCLAVSPSNTALM